MIHLPLPFCVQVTALTAARQFQEETRAYDRGQRPAGGAADSEAQPYGSADEEGPYAQQWPSSAGGGSAYGGTIANSGAYGRPFGEEQGATDAAAYGGGGGGWARGPDGRIEELPAGAGAGDSAAGEAYAYSDASQRASAAAAASAAAGAGYGRPAAQWGGAEAAAAEAAAAEAAAPLLPEDLSTLSNQQLLAEGLKLLRQVRRNAVYKAGPL